MNLDSKVLDKVLYERTIFPFKYAPTKLSIRVVEKEDIGVCCYIIVYMVFSGMHVVLYDIDKVDEVIESLKKAKEIMKEITSGESGD